MKANSPCAENDRWNENLDIDGSLPETNGLVQSRVESWSVISSASETNPKITPEGPDEIPQ